MVTEIRVNKVEMAKEVLKIVVEYKEAVIVGNMDSLRAAIEGLVHVYAVSEMGSSKNQFVGELGAVCTTIYLMEAVKLVESLPLEMLNKLKEFKEVIK